VVRDVVLRPSLRSFAASVVALVAAATLGCGLLSFDPESPPENHCGGARECPGDTTCHPELHICVANQRPATGVFLRFTYPASRGVQIREFQSYRLETPSDLRIDLPAPVVVEGWVAGDDPLRTVRADITLSRPSPIPDEPPETAKIEASDAAAWFEDPARGVAFSAAVLPYTPERGAYTAYVEPKGDDSAVFPPVMIPDLRIVQPAGGEPYRLEVLLPPRTTLRRVVGRVMWGASGVPNLSVRAEDSVTGLRISTIAKTALAPTMAGGDPVPPAEGTFEIFLPDGVTPFRLVAAPTTENPTVPTTVWDNILFNTLDTNHDGVLVFNAAGSDPIPDQPALALPAYTLVSLEGTVEGTAAGSLGSGPVSDATLRFFREVETDTLGVTATFEQRAQTDSYGQITAFGCDPTDPLRSCLPGVALIEGDYSVTVTPPADLQMAGLHLDFFRVARPSPDDPVQRGRVFELEPRADLDGEVLDLMGRPARALRIESRLVAPAGSVAGADLIYLNSVINGSTDFDGAFDMYVEPGTHVLVLRPADSAQFPWRLVPNLAAPDGAVNTSLEAPVVVQGSVKIGADYTAGVVIEALVRDESFGDGPVQVGRAETDASGAFLLLLSPSL